MQLTSSAGGQGGSGLFGNRTGGFFGTGTATGPESANRPTTSGGLFGSAAGTTQPSNVASTSITPSLFGAPGGNSSLFGAQQQQQQGAATSGSTPLFGGFQSAAAAPAQPAGTSLFGGGGGLGSTSLFGGTSTNVGTGGFGTMAGTTTSAAPGSQLFGGGATAAAGSSPSAGGTGSLFGAPSSGSTAPSSGPVTGLFSTAPASSTGGTPGLFGGATTTTAAAPVSGATTATSSLFGTGLTSTKPSTSSSSLFGTGTTSTGTLGMSLFGAPAGGGGSSSLFGSTAPATQTAPSVAAPAGNQTGISSLLGLSSQPPSFNSAFGPPPKASTMTTGAQFGFSVPTEQQTAAGAVNVGAAKRFLPYAPSVQEFFAVAPEWRPAFETIADETDKRQELITRLRASLAELSTRNSALKNALGGYEDKSRSNALSQSWIASEAESVQQAVWKLHRQASALAIVWRRTLESGTSAVPTAAASAAQALVIPQPDYLRIVHDLQLRSQRIQRRAEQLQCVVAQLGRELALPTPSTAFEAVPGTGSLTRSEAAGISAPTSGIPAPPAVELKNLFHLLTRKLKSLKLRQLGLDEELRAAFDLYQQKHPSGLE